MGKEENALMQQNAQAQISVSEQPLEAYKQRGAEEYGDERMARDKQKTEEARALRQAESLRHSLASGHMNRDLKSLARRNARAEERPASAPQEMSERQKKKRDKRKEKGLRRVRKQYGPGATEDTLPMAQRVAEYRKERREAGEDGPEDLESMANALRESNPEELKGAFTKLIDVPGQSGAFIAELKGHMEKNRLLGRRLDAYDKLSPAEREARFTPFQRAQVEELRSAQFNLEKMLRISLAANGVDFDTGGPVRPDVAQKAKANLIAEHEAYKKSFDAVKEMETDALAAEMNSMAQSKLQDPAFGRRIEEDKAADAAETGVDFDKFPVVYGPDFKRKYGEYQLLRAAIDSHPDEYGAHKDLVDRMMAEMLDVWNKLSQENLFLRAAEEVKTDLRKSGDAYAAERFKTFPDKWREEHTAPAEDRFALLTCGVSFLLTGKRPSYTDESSWQDVQLESEFGIVTEYRERHRDEALEAGEKLARIERLDGTEEMGDIYTGDAVLIGEEIQEDERRRDNAMRDLCPKDFWGDRRAMRTFFRGYAVDESGAPASEADLADKQADEAFAHAFVSGDHALMEPYLGEIVGDFLRADFGEKILKEGFIKENALGLKQFADKAWYIEELKKMAPWYFDRLPKERLERLNEVLDLEGKYQDVLSSMLADEGVILNSGRLFSAREPVAELRESLPSKLAVFTEAAERRKSERVRKLGGPAELDVFYSEDSLLAAEELREDRKRRDNAVRDLSKTLKRRGRDARALAIYARGYDKGKDGEPLTEADRQNKEADGEFMREYFSGDSAVRERRLDLITDELLAMEPTEATSKEMAADDYILNNAVELRQCCQKILYLETLRKENPAYFENLPAEKAERLKALFNAYLRYEALLTFVLAAHGVRQSNGDLVGDRNEIFTNEMLKVAPYGDFLNTVRMNDAARSFAAARRGA